MGGSHPKGGNKERALTMLRIARGPLLTGLKKFTTTLTHGRTVNLKKGLASIRNRPRGLADFRRRRPEAKPLGRFRAGRGKREHDGGNFWANPVGKSPTGC